jgi:hypothetical protein
MKRCLFRIFHALGLGSKNGRTAVDVFLAPDASRMRKDDALIMAALTGLTDDVKTLISAGANVHADNDGPLHGLYCAPARRRCPPPSLRWRK